MSEQLFKDFFKFYKKANPMGMGATAAAALSAEEKEEAAAQVFKNFLKFYNKTNPTGMGATAAAALPAAAEEKEEAAQGDSFSGIVEKRASAPDPEPEPEHEPLPNAKYGVGIYHPHLKPTKYGNVGIASDQKLYPDLGFTWANKEEGDFTVRPYTMEEMKAVAGDNQDLFGTGYDDGPPTADPEAKPAEPAAEISIEDSSNIDMDNSEAEMIRPTRELRQDHLESSKKAFGTKSRDKSRQAEEDREAHLESSKKAFGTKSRDVMAESAEPASEVDYTDKAIEIFKDLHATEFDPKSRMDRGKLEKMKSMLADVGGIGDEDGAANKFALQFYRNS